MNSAAFSVDFTKSVAFSVDYIQSHESYKLYHYNQTSQFGTAERADAGIGNYFRRFCPLKPPRGDDSRIFCDCR